MTIILLCLFFYFKKPIDIDELNAYYANAVGAQK